MRIGGRDIHDNDFHKAMHLMKNIRQVRLKKGTVALADHHHRYIGDICQRKLRRRTGHLYIRTFANGQKCLGIFRNCRGKMLAMFVEKSTLFPTKAQQCAIACPTRQPKKEE